MKEQVTEIYQRFDAKRKNNELIEEDKNDLQALEDIQNTLKLK